MSIKIMIDNGLSARKAMHLAGTSQGSYYYRKRKNERNMKDKELLPKVQELSLRKPMYGTRMMAAYASRELNRPVNRKAVKHAFRLLGWNRPQLKKRDLIKASDKAPKPSGINQLWEADMTVRCRCVVLSVQRHRCLFKGMDILYMCLNRPR